MRLSRSTFYYQPKRQSPDQIKVEADLRDRIETICLGFPRYGYRRVTYQLKREGKLVNHKKVLRLMRESDLLCRGKAEVGEDYRLEAPFPQVSQPHQGDGRQPAKPGVAIGHHLHPHQDGLCLPGSNTGRLLAESHWLRRIHRLDTTLTLQALKMAITQRKPGLGIIHHSDQGVQYASAEYVAELQKHGFLMSMARAGNPYENAVMESFFRH
jgi:hypothetical protein